MRVQNHYFCTLLSRHSKCTAFIWPCSNLPHHIHCIKLQYSIKTHTCAGFANCCVPRLTAVAEKTEHLPQLLRLKIHIHIYTTHLKYKHDRYERGFVLHLYKGQKYDMHVQIYTKTPHINFAKTT